MVTFGYALVHGIVIISILETGKGQLEIKVYSWLSLMIIKEVI